MAIAQRYVAQQHTGRGGPSGLADVLEVLLDKGLVIDAFVRVSLIGIELLTVDARVVVASVDTYLRFAEAVNRLDLLQSGNSQTLGDLVSGGGQRQRGRSGRDGNEKQDGKQEARREDRLPEKASLEPGHDGGGRAGQDRDQAGDRAGQRDRDAEAKRGNEQGSKAGSDGQGLLARLKQRGQVF